MTLVHWSMPPVSLRTNFMDPKALASFFYGAACQSNLLCSAARMKMTDAPGQRTLLQLREWLSPQGGYSEIANTNSSARRRWLTNSGLRIQRGLPRQSNTEPVR